MDTDELSKEAYTGILIEAEKFTHDLTLHYGLLSYSCKDESEYLQKAEELTMGIMQADEIVLDDIFWGDPPDKKKLNATLLKILKNIERIKSIPVEKRNYDF